MRNCKQIGALLLLCYSVLLLQHALAEDETKGMRSVSQSGNRSGDSEKKSDDSSTSPSAANVDFSPSFIDSPLLDILWCGSEKQTILILTDKGTVYKTKDLGKNWEKLREMFQKTAKKQAKEEENIGDVSNMIQNPVDPNLVIFLGSAGINWVTEDCGSTIKAINSGKNIKEFLFHPFERNWVLASAYTTCEDFTDEPCKIYKELYVSQNIGETWGFVADYVIQFAWGVPEGHQFFANFPAERVVIAHHLVKKGNQQFRGWAEEAEIAYSDDFFKTKTTILDRGNKFLITQYYFFAVQVDDEDTQSVRMLIGNPDTRNYKLEPIVLPTKKQNKKKKEGKILEHSYTILDTSEEQVFLHINHEGERSKYGNLYISDSTGLRYSLSLHNNVRNLGGQCDFEKVSGLEGIYLSNVYDPQIINKIRSDLGSSQEIATSAQSSKPTGKTKSYQAVSSAAKDKDQRLKELDEYKMTMISFDKGGIWEPLKPPKLDANGNRIECEDEDGCFLNLHSISNNKFGPFYSTDNSLGIVIGVGNVGKYLSNKEDEVNTYLSRDGGLTWYEVLKGSHIFEIGDHGAIIVASPDQEATKNIYYTWNEGLTWETLQVSDVPIQVSNIIIEPSNTAEHFVLYGRTSSSSKDKNKEPKGIVISIDFASLHKTTCRNPNKPDEESSDYEKWSPNGIISAHCLMGHQTTYIRRKREAQCFNTEEMDQWFSIVNCQCTEEDWECDIGFERKKDGPCVNTTADPISIEPPEECDGEFYYVTQGYRKVAGNTCHGGVDHEPIKLRCPTKGILKSKSFVFFCLIVLVGAIYFYTKRAGPSNPRIPAFNPAARPASSGFQPMNENIQPDSFHGNEDEDDEFDSQLKFDEYDEPSQQTDLMGVVQGKKRMAGRSGLNTAQKNIPMISRPGGGSSDRRSDLM